MNRSLFTERLNILPRNPRTERHKNEPAIAQPIDITLAPAIPFQESLRQPAIEAASGALLNELHKVIADIGHGSHAEKPTARELRAASRIVAELHNASKGELTKNNEPFVREDAVGWAIQTLEAPDVAFLAELQPQVRRVREGLQIAPVTYDPPAILHRDLGISKDGFKGR